MSTNSTLSPGEGPVYAGGDDSQGVSVRESSSTSYSETNWAAISFLLLWSLGLVLLGTVLATAWQEKMRLRATNASAQQEPDVEASKNNNSNNYDNEQDQQAGVGVSSSSAGSCLSLTIAMFAAVTAFCISIVPHTSCEYLELSEENNAELISLGLWKVAYAYDSAKDFGGEGKCYSNFRTANFQVDTALTVARVAAILASTIGGICMLVLLYNFVVAFSCLAKVPPPVGLAVEAVGGRFGRSCLAGLLLAATFCQGLTLSIQASDQCQASTFCDLDNGALSAITSTFYWFLCAIATL